MRPPHSGVGWLGGTGLLALGHLLVDVQLGILPVVLLYQRQALGLTLAQVGLVAGVYNFSNSLAQPIFGHLSDRTNERRVAIAGIVWVGILGGLLGFAHSVGALILISGLAGLGPGAFHPPGASGAGRLALSQGRGMSVFFAGGSIGLALGPLIAGAVFRVVGIHGTLWIAVAVLCAVAVWARLTSSTWPSTHPIGAPASRHTRSPAGRANPILWGAVGGLLLLTGARTWIQMSLTTYVPQQLAAIGSDPAEASRWLSFMMGTAAVGVLVGGSLADRFGARRVMIGALAVLGPVALLFALSGSPLAGPLAGLGGLLVGMPLSLTVMVGQSILPAGRGLASALVLCSSFVAGAAGVAIMGVMADRWGLSPTLALLGVLAVIGALGGLLLPKVPTGALASATRTLPE